MHKIELSIYFYACVFKNEFIIMLTILGVFASLR